PDEDAETRDRLRGLVVEVADARRLELRDAALDALQVDENQETEEQRDQCRRGRAIQHVDHRGRVLADPLELLRDERIQVELIAPSPVLGERFRNRTALLEHLVDIGIRDAETGALVREAAL